MTVNPFIGTEAQYEQTPSGASVAVAQTTTHKTNAGYMAAGQSAKTYTGTVSIATGATVTLETVTAGKMFVITDIYIGANTATQFQVNLKSAGTDVYIGFCKGDTGPIQLCGIETQPSATSGSLVTLVFGAAAATTAAYYVAGFEQ